MSKATSQLAEGRSKSRSKQLLESTSRKKRRTLSNKSTRLLRLSVEGVTTEELVLGSAWELEVKRIFFPEILANGFRGLTTIASAEAAAPGRRAAVRFRSLGGGGREGRRGSACGASWAVRCGAAEAAEVARARNAAERKRGTQEEEPRPL
jgi:hypothetical protein